MTEFTQGSCGLRQTRLNTPNKHPPKTGSLGSRVHAVSPSLIGPGFMWTRQTELQAEVGPQYFEADLKVMEQQLINSLPMHHRLGNLENVTNGVLFLMSNEAGFNSDIAGATELSIFSFFEYILIYSLDGCLTHKIF
ncbi:MAG: hypothetical protein AAGE59_21670 [Cyanobacteria bacterium P01_F01_bin.86]